MGDLVLLRHGQTEWSANGRHTSRTEVELTSDGEDEARALAPALAGRQFEAVLSSPRHRALRTAELAGLTVTATEDDLAEWDYGDYEGITTADIRKTRPDWSLWTDGAPHGETPDQVAVRIDRVLAAMAAFLADGDVAIVGHGHSLRVLGARWVGLPPGGGALLKLDTGTLSVLGFEHGRHIIAEWNCPLA